jgi:hypothetical protein
VPWWAALLIATSATVIGFAIDSGHKELTHVFAGCYLAGCVIAVLAVRQSGVFTAVIQPPLILFCAVPGAYWLFHGGKITKIKDLLINCGYPLIERFPLMLGTAGVVLLIGLIRWYFGMMQQPAAGTDDKAETATRGESKLKSLVSGIAAKLRSLLGDSAEDDDEADGAASSGAPAAHAVGRTARTGPNSGRTARGSRSAQRPTRTRSRHSRAAQPDPNDPTAEPRRRRSQPPASGFDPADPPRRPRRQRPAGDPDPRSQPPREPREPRREPSGRRSSYERERPASRGGRYKPYEAYEPPPEPFDRYETPYDRYEPPRRRAKPGGSGGANPNHHPISQVRYRGSVAPDEPREEPRDERRARPRAPRRPQAESREYDV